VACEIAKEERWLRASVGPGLAEEVQECFRAIVNQCLTQPCERVLVVGRAGTDAFAHLAVRDALRSMALAGVPPRFRLALVAATPDLIAIYDAAVLEAERLGIEARRLRTVEEAEQWLSAA
jgi:hypothetical protein